MNTAPLNAAGNALSSTFTGYEQWARNPNVNVLYKTLVLCMVLALLAVIPATQKFAGWAAVLILFILLVQPGQGGSNA